MGGDEAEKSGENANAQPLDRIGRNAGKGACGGRVCWKARARSAEDDDAGVMRQELGQQLGKGRWRGPLVAVLENRYCTEKWYQWKLM
jgi:hypothetical protein